MENLDHHPRSSGADAHRILSHHSKPFSHLPSQSQPSKDLESAMARESHTDAALQETPQHESAHRMAVLPSQDNSKADQLVDVHVVNLTTSDQRLVLSRAMETEGQDNEKLLTKIRQRQDRCVRAFFVLMQPKYSSQLARPWLPQLLLSNPRSWMQLDATEQQLRQQWLLVCSAAACAHFSWALASRVPLLQDISGRS